MLQRNAENYSIDETTTEKVYKRKKQNKFGTNFFKKVNFNSKSIQTSIFLKIIIEGTMGWWNYKGSARLQYMGKNHGGCEL